MLDSSPAPWFIPHSGPAVEEGHRDLRDTQWHHSLRAGTGGRTLIRHSSVALLAPVQFSAHQCERFAGLSPFWVPK